MTARRVLHAVHVFAMGLWFGALIMTAAAAAVIFPTLKALNPSLPAYASYGGEHWMLAAGRVANTIFFISDVVQFICSSLAIGTLLVSVVFLKTPWRNRLTAMRAVLLGTALCLLCYHLFILGPRMSVNLERYWTLAAQGQQQQADEFRAAFSADHPSASRVLGAIAGVAGLGLFLGALARDDEPEAAEAAPAGKS